MKEAHGAQEGTRRRPKGDPRKTPKGVIPGVTTQIQGVGILDPQIPEPPESLESGEYGIISCTHPKELMEGVRNGPQKGPPPDHGVTTPIHPYTHYPLSLG
jgi:hypothetical protein